MRNSGAGQAGRRAGKGIGYPRQLPQVSWIKGTSHDSTFQFSLFPTLADIFAV